MNKLWEKIACVGKPCSFGWETPTHPAHGQRSPAAKSDSGLSRINNRMPVYWSHQEVDVSWMGFISPQFLTDSEWSLHFSALKPIFHRVYGYKLDTVIVLRYTANKIFSVHSPAVLVRHEQSCLRHLEYVSDAAMNLVWMQVFGVAIGGRYKGTGAHAAFYATWVSSWLNFSFSEVRHHNSWPPNREHHQVSRTLCIIHYLTDGSLAHDFDVLGSNVSKVSRMFAQKHNWTWKNGKATFKIWKISFLQTPSFPTPTYSWIIAQRPCSKRGGLANRVSDLDSHQWGNG